MTDHPSPKRERPPKKTELLEVRLDGGTKRDFLAACRQAGRTASDVVREAIQRFVDQQRLQPDGGSLVMMIPKPIRKKRYLAAGLAAVAGLGALVMMPSAAADPDFASIFAVVDSNGDGVVSRDEFLSPPQGTHAARDMEPIPNAPGDGRFRKFMMESQFREYDRNGDMRIDTAEFTEYYVRRARSGFGELDVNRDDVLDLQELEVRDWCRHPRCTGSPQPVIVDRKIDGDLNGDLKIQFEELLVKIRSDTARYYGAP